MKHILLKAKQWIIVASGLFFLTSCATGSVLMQVTNLTPVAQPDAAVVLTRESLANILPLSQSRRVPAIFLPSGKQMPMQVDDLDNDGQWDEIFMPIDIGATESLTFRVKMVKPNRIKAFAPRSQVWFASISRDTVITPLNQGVRLTPEEGTAAGRFQFEGPGWENDRVGFRNYFDARNGMDIFGKTTQELVLHRVGVNEDYHRRQHWGMDVLRVGASLGAGSLALEKNGVLHRVAPTANGTVQVLVNGPLRSKLRFAFNDWMIDGVTYNIVHYISIAAGAWYYESEVFLEGDSNAEVLLTGMASIDLLEKNAVETIHDEAIVSLATFGNQAFDGEGLGMAIMLHQSDYLGYSRLGPNEVSVTNTFTVKMRRERNHFVNFRFYAVWEPSSDAFGNLEGFHELLRRDALLKAHPLRIEFER